MQTQTQEIDLLKSAMRQASDKRMYERYLAVLHHLEGHTIREIARMIKRTEKTTSAYIHHYREGGLDALALGHSTGKPHRLSDEQEQQLAQTIAHKQPAEVGIEAKFTWTLKLAILYVEREFDQTFSERGMSKLLHRLGFSHTKATYTLELADPDEQEAFRSETFPALKKACRRTNRPFAVRRRVDDPSVPILAVQLVSQRPSTQSSDIWPARRRQTIWLSQL